MDEEQKVGAAAERLSASAFLARYRSFRYIETRSGMKMSDTSHSPLATSHSLALTREGSTVVNVLPRAFFAKGASQQGPKLAPLQGLSNRELELLERPLTHRKQTVAPGSNRELSTNQCSRNRLRQGTAFYPEVRRAAVPGSTQSSGVSTPEVRELNGAAEYEVDYSHFSTLLTGSAPQTEFDVTCRKQTPAHFLTGSRIAQLDAGICARMSAQISSKLSTEMTGLR